MYKDEACVLERAMIYQTTSVQSEHNPYQFTSNHLIMHIPMKLYSGKEHSCDDITLGTGKSKIDYVMNALHRA